MSLTSPIFKNIGYHPADLKPYITDCILRYARDFLFFEHTIAMYRKPHWRSRLFKNINRAGFLVDLARSPNMDVVIDMACKHFNKSNTRAFNIFFKNIYLGSLLGKRKTSNEQRRFFYYLAIRIRKRNIELNGRKVLVYFAKVGRMCGWGQVIHKTIPKNIVNLSSLKEFR